MDKTTGYRKSRWLVALLSYNYKDGGGPTQHSYTPDSAVAKMLLEAQIQYNFDLVSNSNFTVGMITVM